MSLTDHPTADRNLIGGDFVTGPQADYRKIVQKAVIFKKKLSIISRGRSV
jgi:hypothetical protein